MRLFARIEDGVVREIFETGQDMAGLFHAALRWVEVTGQEVAAGFRETEAGFVAPVIAPVAATGAATVAAAEGAAAPALEALRAEVAALAARLAALG